jgi:hypothetical protein
MGDSRIISTVNIDTDISDDKDIAIDIPIIDSNKDIKEEPDVDDFLNSFL